MKETVEITTDSGERVKASAPVVLSASRATDIPAFYADWFFTRLKRGYAVRRNPFNGIRSYISFARVRVVVFWSKNPRPLFPYLGELEERGIRYYVQYTLNDYEAERLEPGVPPLAERIETFRELAERLGKGRVVWRFDPFVLTDRIGVGELLRKVERIGDRLYGYADRLVFSFADIGGYRRVQAGLRRNGVRYRDFDEPRMLEMAEGLAALNRRWRYRLAACAEAVDLSRFGIERNKCIDDGLMAEHFSDDAALMDFLGAETGRNNLFGPMPTLFRRSGEKDRGQRRFCGCIPSRDIGEYGTCPHLCVYCYANGTPEKAAENYRAHCADPGGETITGR